MMASRQGGSVTTGAATSVQALCRREAWQFASWWADFALMGGAAAVTWLLAQQPTPRLLITDSYGAITASAVGLCAGASFPLLMRIYGAWRLGRRLERGRGGDPKSGLRTQFLAASLHEAGASAMRCSEDDLRRTASIAVSEAVRAGLNTAMPATVAAFVAPAMALIGGLDMAKRTAQASPIVVMAPSMIAGEAGGMVVVVLVHAFTAAIRAGVQGWGDGVNLDEVAQLAGRPISRGVHIAHPGDGAVDGGGETSSSTVGIEDYEQTLRKLTQSG